MNRRSIGTYIWIIYPIFWLLWIIVLPRFFPQVNGYGYFIPFFFFFPFFRRRGGRRTPRPVPAQSSPDKQQEEQEYRYENMLADENYKPPYSIRNYLFYAVGAVIIVIGIVLVYTKIF